jgi:3',5'-cyclic AMP phosphodiesterase CpdA
MLIAQLSDLHVRPEGQPANRVVETNMFAERAFRAVAAFSPRPDVVIISGDLADTGLDTEYALCAQLLRRHLTMPVLVIPGNHDRRVAFREGLAHLPGVGSDPHFIQYVIDAFSVRFVMLDTLVPGADHGELCNRRLAFLEQALAAAPHKPTIIVMHHPPFVCGIDHMDKINLCDSASFRAILARHPQVERVLCGHHHRPVTARVAGAVVCIAPSAAHQVELALTPGAPGAMVMEPPAFLLHTWIAGEGIVSHTAYVEPFPGPYPFLIDPDYPGAVSG